MKIPAPLQLHRDKVRPEWIDYNGHLNLAFYVLIFDHATDALLDYIGMTEQFRNANKSSTFAAELHVTYEQEVKLDEEVSVTTQLLGFDEKRIHYFHRMYSVSTDTLVATNELMSLYMDISARRVAIMPEALQARLGDILVAHSVLPLPVQAGSVIGLQRKSRPAAAPNSG